MANSDLASYQLQLQQVEAALTADPENAELLTLKADLEQVINLTKELITAQAGEIIPDNTCSENSGYEKPNKTLEELECSSTTNEPDDDISSNSKHQYTFDEVETVRQPIKHWQVGEQCQALWHKDGQYYDANIEEITTDGEVSVKFKSYNNSTVTTLVLLKAPTTGSNGPSSSKNRKEELAKQREYLKKKKS